MPITHSVDDAAQSDEDFDVHVLSPAKLIRLR